MGNSVNWVIVCKFFGKDDPFWLGSRPRNLVLQVSLLSVGPSLEMLGIGLRKN